MRRLLPNCIGFGANVYDQDFLAALFGIVKNRRELKIIKSERVSEANAYLTRQYERLEKAAQERNQTKFDRISDTLLRKSKIYELVGLHRTLNGWFFKMSMKDLCSTLRALGKLMKTRGTAVEYTRIYIPKGKDEWGRPLGVPTLEWRVWSWMNLNILEIWARHSEQIPEWQHGGLAQKGLITCWKEVIRKVLPARYIFEFDLKGFFNNVSYESVNRFMKEWGYGKHMKAWVAESIKSKPTKYKTIPIEYERPKIVSDTVTLELKTMGIELEKLNRVYDEADRIFNERYGYDPAETEDVRIREEDLPKLPANGQGDRITIAIVNPMKDDKEAQDYWDILNKETNYQAVMEALKEENGNKYYEKEWKANPETTAKERLTGPDETFLDNMIKVREQHFDLGHPDKGLPQGLGTSPFLSVMALAAMCKRRGIKEGIVMYMDDGLIYGNTEVEVLDRLENFERGLLEEMGIRLAEEKSGFVKGDGNWWHPFKFLGLEYNGITNEIRAKTRNGATAVFPKAEFTDLAGRLWIQGTSKNARLLLLRKVLNRSAHEIATEYGLMGLLTAKAQAPEGKYPRHAKEIDIQMRALIEKGIRETIHKMLTNTRTYRWDNQEQFGDPDIDPKHIMYESTRAIEVYLDDSKLAKRVAKSTAPKTRAQLLRDEYEWVTKRLRSKDRTKGVPRGPEGVTQ